MCFPGLYGWFTRWGRGCVSVFWGTFLLKILFDPFGPAGSEWNIPCCSDATFGGVLPKCLLSRSLRIQCISEEYSRQNFLAKLVDSWNHRTKRNYRSFEWFAESPFIKCFSLSTRGPGRFADSSDTPWNLPTICRRSLIATILHNFLPWFCVPLFQQCQLSQNDEVLTYNDLIDFDFEDGSHRRDARHSSLTDDRRAAETVGSLYCLSQTTLFT